MMKIKHSWLVLVILAILVFAYGVASADNPLTYDVYVDGQYTCFDFGEWGQCLCPCDAVDCNSLLAVNEPPGIGGGPAVDDWIEATDTPTITATSEPIPTNHPKGEPTNTPPPTPVVIPTREQPPVWPSSTPVPIKPIPPTATARPTLVPIVPPTVPPVPTEEPEDECVGNPGNQKCKGKAGEKDDTFNPPPDGPGDRGRSDGLDKPPKPTKKPKR